MLARSSRTPGRLSGCRRITAAARRILDEPLVFVRLDPNFAPVPPGNADVDHEIQDGRVALRRGDPALGTVRRGVADALPEPEPSWKTAETRGGGRGGIRVRCRWLP